MKAKNKNKIAQQGNKNIFLILYVSLIIFLIIGIFFLTTLINTSLKNSSFSNIEEQLQLQKEVIVAELDSDADNVTLFAKSIAKEENISENFKSLLEGKTVGAPDSRVYFLDESAQGYINDDTYLDLSGESYYPLLLEGKTIISNVRFSELGSTFFVIAPVIDGANIRGFVLNEISTFYLENLLAAGFDGMLYTYIVDALGNTISLNMNSYVILPSEPLRTILQRAEYEMSLNMAGDFDAILSDFAEGKSGAFEIHHFNNTRLGYYAPLGINSWYLVSFLPEEAISDTITIVRIIMSVMMVALLVIILLLVMNIWSLTRKNTKIRNDLIHELTSRIDADPITKLYIREETESRIATYLSYTHDKQTSSIILIDIDDFKRVNELLGEEAGDLVLHDAAQEIKKCFRSSDIVGRIDGNLFIVLLRNNDDINIITQKAEKILYGLSDVEFGDDDFLTASIGIAICPTDAKDFRNLYAKADAALYHVKVMGKDGYAFYDDSLKDRIRHIELKGDSKADNPLEINTPK